MPADRCMGAEVAGSQVLVRGTDGERRIPYKYTGTQAD